MQISNIFLDDRVGGPHQRVAAVSKLLRQAGFSSEVIVPECNKTTSDFFARHEMRVKCIPYLKLSKSLSIRKFIFCTVIGSCMLIKYFRKNSDKCFIVYGSLALQPLLCAIISRKKNNIIWFINDELNWWGLKASFWIITKLNIGLKVVVQSKRNQNRLNIVSKAEPLPSPIRPEIYSSDRKVSLPKTKKIQFGILANISRIKNIEWAIQLTHYLRMQGYDASLTIQGKKASSQSEYQTVLNNLVLLLGIKQHIRFMGYSENLNRFFSEVDFLIMCSHSESSPNSVSDAVGFATPVISFDVGSVEETLSVNGQFFGLLVKCRSQREVLRYLESIDNQEEARLNSMWMQLVYRLSPERYVQRLTQIVKEGP